MSDKLDEAYAKAIKKKERDEKIRVCLLADICPECAAGHLELYETDNGFKFTDKYKCFNCGNVISMPQ